MQLIRDIIPPLAAASPRLRFHLGRVANNMPVISPTLPAMSDYPTSPYYVVQWNQTSYIEPVLLQKQDRTTYDSRLGKAQFAFEAPDRHSHVSIYPSGQSWIYELYEAGGTLRKTGGSNIFLSSDKMASTATFDHVLNLDFDAKISMASISGSKSQANGRCFHRYSRALAFGTSIRRPDNNKLYSCKSRFLVAVAQSVGTQSSFVPEPASHSSIQTSPTMKFFYHMQVIQARFATFTTR